MKPPNLNIIVAWLLCFLVASRALQFIEPKYGLFGDLLEALILLAITQHAQQPTT